MAAATRAGQTTLALRLAKKLAPAPAPTEGAAATTYGNVAFSPVSIHAALALAAAGARGATLDQMLAFLGAPSAAGLTDFSHHVADRVLANQAGSGGPRVLFGGGVWVDAKRGGLKKAFRDVAAESYKSEARTVNFVEKPEEAVEMINSWVKKATNNLVDSIISVDDITPATDLVLANAVYFKAKWLFPFDSRRTWPDTFHRLDGSRVEAQFMSKTMYNMHYVSCVDGFKILKLPYKHGPDAPWLPYRHGRDGRGAAACKASPGADDTRYSMFVFLPDERHGFADMVDAITAAPGYLYSVLPKTEVGAVTVRLPKFEISFNWDLDSDLRLLGLTLPFSPELADLRGMCEKDDDGRPTFLSKVAHTAVVKVNEEGTEAAAVTFIMRPGAGMPPKNEFVADHPFTFFIMEEQSGVIVFAGHVLDPTKILET